MANIKELREVIALCTEYGISYIKYGDIEMHISGAFQTPEELSVTSAAPERPVYENDMLYPNRRDPVAEMREWRKEREFNKDG